MIRFGRGAENFQCGANGACLGPDDDGFVVCENSLQAWCAAHGLNNPQHRKTLEALGATTYLDFLELSTSDRQKLVNGLRLELVQRKKVLAALDPEILALFYECTKKKASVDEYHQLSTERSLKKAAAEERPLETSSSDRSGGVHVVPHKVVALNREKAMRCNPNFQDCDFVSFKTDRFHLPPGGSIKVILMVGKTNAGKTMTINSFVNHLFGVEFNDPFRLKLIRESTRERHRHANAPKTDQVIGYLLEAPPALGDKDWLLIIDTPGFGNSRGLLRDEAILEELNIFFRSEINHLSAVCFVNQARDTRLTVTQQWMYEKILSMFAGASEDIAALLFTCCDTEDPPALQAMRNSGIRFSQSLKLNNCGFISREHDESQINCTLNMAYWDQGMKSFQLLVEFIQMSNEYDYVGKEGVQVLSGREKLADSIEDAWRAVEDGICHLLSLEQIAPLIVKARSRIGKKNAFEVSTTKYLRVKKKTESSYNIVCDACQCTCQENIMIGEDGINASFASVGMDGHYCTKCPRSCHWSNHRIVDCYWDLREYNLHKKIKEIKARYVRASSCKSELEQIMNGFRREFHKTQNEVYDLVNCVQDMINELEQSTLPPDVFLGEYAELMSNKHGSNETKKVWKWRKGIVEAGSKYISHIGMVDPFDEKIEGLMKETHIQEKLALVRNAPALKKEV